MRFALRLLVLLMLISMTRVAGAQIIETPVPFDSAGKIRTMTPALVTRLALTAPQWPVAGDFTEARLFDVSSGGQVLVVERRDGRIERYPLNTEHATALRFAVDAAMRTSGAPVSDARAEPVVEPARGTFVRNQMLLTWGVYGPLLAALADDPKGGTALVLLATGASYFAATALSRKTVITPAQNHLSTDGAIRGAGVGLGTLYAVAGDASSRSFAASGLVGAVAGQITGFRLGRKLTIGEAEAATALSTYAAATAFGLVGSTGLIDEADNARGAVGAALGAGLVGYLLGPQYPRRASYTVTRGDVQILGTGAVLGAAAGLVPHLHVNVSDEKAVFASATAGMLAGLFLVERGWVRKYDHAARDAAETSLGAGAGALMGVGIGVLTDADVRGMGGLMTGGGILGALVAHNLANPQRAGVRVGTNSPRLRRSRVTLSINPAEMALGAARVPGRYAMLNVKF